MAPLSSEPLDTHPSKPQDLVEKTIDSFRMKSQDKPPRLLGKPSLPVISEVLVIIPFFSLFQLTLILWFKKKATGGIKGNCQIYQAEQ